MELRCFGSRFLDVALIDSLRYESLRLFFDAFNDLSSIRDLRLLD